ncbi:MAG: hypothetical protein QG646_3964, partial [Euryarchaeota archaeon]|nr:hypothetical protein [Euryarchaeota archaeon]
NDNSTNDNSTNDNSTNDNSTNDNSTNNNSTNDNGTIVDLIANFTSDVTCGYAPLTVNFNDMSEGEPTSRYWDFGDGMNSTVEDPVHTYCHSGKYDVTLTVANELGNNTVIKYDYINVGTRRQSQDTDEECSTETKEDCENTKPICEETKPVCKETKPVCKETKPVCKETKPVCKETKPVCKENNPADDNGEVDDNNQANDEGEVDDNNQADDEGEVDDNNQADDNGESNTAQSTNSSQNAA